MDQNPTAAEPSNPTGDRPAASSLRRLWQVPLFFLGAVALLTALLTRGFVQPDPTRQLHHDLNEARRLLHHRNGDPARALEHARHAADNLMYDPGRGAEAFFLLGSAHVQLAEAGGDSAREHWGEAKRCLEEAQRRGLGGDDAGRLQYRLAKVGFYTDDDPRRVVALLKASKDLADDRAEALTLLTQAYLRLDPPNIKDAMAANRELREKVPQVGEDVLGPAKLTGAKLLLRLGQQEEARKTLEKISDQAPPAALAEARMLLAGLYQEEQKWSQAAELWTTVLAEKRVPLAEPGGVLYNLGVCCRHLDQLPRAAEAWADCLKRSHGEEAQAAALALAELRLHEGAPDKAAEMLAEAVAKVRKADDWKNSLLDLPRVQDLFEKAVSAYRQAGRFDLAVQAAELYERVAAPPRAQALRAELCTEWGRTRLEQAKKVKDAEARAKDESTAHELFRRAAEAHAEVARLAPKKPAAEEARWLSAVCSFDGRDFPRAAEKLTKILEADLENTDRQSEAWFLLGEAHRNLKNTEAAEQAYKKCIECEARFTGRARYQLAMIDIEAGRIDQAVANLDQNIKLEHHDGDQEAQDKSRLALCALLYQGGAKMPQNYRTVVMNLGLESRLDRMPLTPESVRARYQLADSYRQLAAQRTVNHFMSEKLSADAHEHYLEENRRSLARAAEEFAKLEEVLKDAELSSLLTLKQRAEVPFIVAQCRYDLGEFDKALEKYEELAKQFPNRPEGIYALSGVARCYGTMEKFEQMRRRIDEIRALLPATEGLSEADRQGYRDWLDQVSKVPPPSRKGPQGRQADGSRREPRKPAPAIDDDGPSIILRPGGG